MGLFSRTLFVLVAVFLVGLEEIAAAAEPQVQFNRDIRPILSEHCFACHGPDDKARKGDLRLDTQAGVLEGNPKHGASVVPKDLEASELWHRITTSDGDDVMPPEKSNKPLSTGQIALIREWILAGAPWQGHWSLVKPERPPVPEMSDVDFVIRNPIDSFVFSKLQEKELSPAVEADRRTLARRVALDLTGLPPSVAELEGFVYDTTDGAYEEYVDHLLNSPQWGEHRARYWLDAARYADTHGLHFDNYREIWPYRDWVISAFNRNQPFDLFTIDQIAGDLLPNPSQEQIVATGFQRCNMSTNEGGTIEVENLANYAADRVTTTGWVWLGLTINCASCHDHKFDPLTTRDFYSMAAFYRNTEQTGFDRNRRESDLYMIVPQTERDQLRWKVLPGEIEKARTEFEEVQVQAEERFTNWLATAESPGSAGSVAIANELLHLPLVDNTKTSVSGSMEGREVEFSFSGRLGWRQDGALGGAPVLSREQRLEIGGVADLDGNEPFSMGAWIRLPEGFKGEGAILSKVDEQDEANRGWKFFVRDRTFGLSLTHRPRSNALGARARNEVLKPGIWQHLFVTYGGTRYARDVTLYLDGEQLDVSQENDRLEYSIRNKATLRVGSDLDGIAIQDVRMFRRQLDAPEIRALAAAARWKTLLAQVRQADPGNTNNIPAELLRGFFLQTVDGDWQSAHDRYSALRLEKQSIRARSPVSLVQREKADSEPMANVLFRGQYDQPREKVGPAPIAALHAMPPGAPRNRLGLAQWIVSPENPLTARVTVNRFWQEVFGVGLVKSVEDFGVMGERPVNQQLLDWLALDFQESGWDVKRLFRQIVMSSTYRQSAVTDPVKLEKDPENRFLSRGPRFRMDGEMIRDYALAAGGLLSSRLGGPSVKPYQPAGVWEAVAMPESNTGHYTISEGGELYRRSLYTFWKRAAPPATLELFNAPSRETCTVRRERTNTPLQALATLNSPEFVEAARHLAERAAEAGTRAEGVEYLSKRLLGRTFESEERAVVERTLEEMMAFYGAHPETAVALLSVGASPRSGTEPAARVAAWTMVANQLMNLDEVLNK